MIALYKGISAVSRLIRLRTWSDYSHASWIDDSFDFEIEAWHRGVTQTDVPFSNHTPGTQVDLFDYALPTDQRCAAVRFLRLQIGKPYDWPGLLLFGRAQAKPNRSWFCSELLFAALDHVHESPLQRIKQSQVYPGLLSYSPRLVYLRTCIVPDYKALSAPSARPRDTSSTQQPTTAGGACGCPPEPEALGI